MQLRLNDQSGQVRLWVSYHKMLEGCHIWGQKVKKYGRWPGNEPPTYGFQKRTNKTKSRKFPEAEEVRGSWDRRGPRMQHTHPDMISWNYEYWKDHFKIFHQGKSDKWKLKRIRWTSDFSSLTLENNDATNEVISSKLFVKTTQKTQWSHTRYSSSDCEG